MDKAAILTAFEGTLCGVRNCKRDTPGIPNRPACVPLHKALGEVVRLVASCCPSHSAPSGAFNASHCCGRFLQASCTSRFISFHETAGEVTKDQNHTI